MEKYSAQLIAQEKNPGEEREEYLLQIRKRKCAEAESALRFLRREDTRELLRLFGAVLPR